MKMYSMKIIFFIFSLMDYSFINCALVAEIFGVRKVFNPPLLTSTQETNLDRSNDLPKPTQRASSRTETEVWVP